MKTMALRITVIVQLVLLALQYELGMAVNVSDPRAIAPFQFSQEAVTAALRAVGTTAVLHAALGGILLLLALAILVLALASHVRGAQIFGALSFLSMTFAGYGGLQFVLSGFQDDHATHNMATNFLLSFALYFMLLYLLKPASPQGDSG